MDTGKLGEGWDPYQAMDSLIDHLSRHLRQLPEKDAVQYVQTTGKGSLGGVRLDDVIGERIAQLSEAGGRILELVSLAGEPRGPTRAPAPHPFVNVELIHLLGRTALARAAADPTGLPPTPGEPESASAYPGRVAAV